MRRIFAFLMSMLILGCSNVEWNPDFEEDYFSTYTFLAAAPDSGEEVAQTNRSYKIGDSYEASALPDCGDSDIAGMRPGYTVGGWKYYKNPLDGTTDLPSTMVEDGEGILTRLTVTPQPAVLYASSWTAITYTIVFDGNGGYDPNGSMSPLTLSYDTPTALPGNSFKKEGHAFSGWNTEPDGSGRYFSDEETVLNLTATAGDTIILYAQWSKNSYDVILHSNSGNDDKRVIQVTWGESATLGDNYSYGFYYYKHRFVKWTENEDGSGNSYNSGDTITPTGPMELYAQWQDTYFVTLDDGSDSQTFYGEYIIGETLEVPVSPFSRTGYTFSKWKDDSGTEYSAGTTISISGELTLYAIWDAATYTLSFNPNGGIGNQSGMTYRHGDTVQIPVNSYSRNGYNFVGWNTLSDGSGDSYTAGREYELNGYPSLLYAQWTPKGNVRTEEEVAEALSIEISYSENGMTFTSTAGYSSYAYYLDGMALWNGSSWLTGVTVSGNSATVSYSSGYMNNGYHFLTVVVTSSSGEKTAVTKNFTVD